MNQNSGLFSSSDVEGVCVVSDKLTNSILMQQSWLLKTTAIELHVLASKHQRTNLQRLIQVSIFCRKCAVCFRVSVTQQQTIGINRENVVTGLLTLK